MSDISPLFDTASAALRAVNTALNESALPDAASDALLTSRDRLEEAISTFNRAETAKWGGLFVEEAMLAAECGDWAPGADEVGALQSFQFLCLFEDEITPQPVAVPA